MGYHSCFSCVSTPCDVCTIKSPNDAFLRTCPCHQVTHYCGLVRRHPQKAHLGHGKMKEERDRSEQCCQKYLEGAYPLHYRMFSSPGLPTNASGHWANHNHLHTFPSIPGEAELPLAETIRNPSGMGFNHLLHYQRTVDVLKLTRWSELPRGSFLWHLAGQCPVL